ncbi:MAG: TauD/TfdA dioxygenase family protein [Acidimicrobiia bacterium]
MSAFKYRRLTRHVGAELLEPPPLGSFSAEQIEALKAALADFGVIFFRNDTLEPVAHMAFAGQFGPVRAPSVLIETLASAGFPDIGVISTENKLAYGSDKWHSDVTWMPEPSQYSILHMQVSPDLGGDTMWSAQFAAYETLSDPMKRYLNGRTALHKPSAASDLEAHHPMVVRHPRNGRLALFANNLFTRSIDGVDEDESTAILSYLKMHAIRPEFICRWTWSNGDIAVWDNHYVQHYALGDYHPAPRKIHRVEILGHAPVGA